MNQPPYPHQMYGPYNDSMQKIIAAGLDYPEAILTNNWGDINFSAGQLMMGDAEMRHRRLREWVSEEFENWWHGEWLKRATLRGMDIVPVTKVQAAIDGVGWNGAVVPPADMAKAAAANKTLVEMGAKSVQQVSKELGYDPDQMMKEREEGNQDGHRRCACRARCRG